MPTEATGERFRRLGDELRELTGGEHYYVGTGHRGTGPGGVVYAFSFGEFSDPAVADAELIDRLAKARDTATQKP